MEPCAIAIPDSACFQAFWAEEAETGDAVRSHADSLIRCLDRKQEGAGMGGKSQQKPPAYPLSLKDLCVLPFLPELMDAKIDSFKIEGRMKSPEYVAGVTAIYRKYMDLYLTGSGALANRSGGSGAFGKALRSFGNRRRILSQA